MAQEIVRIIRVMEYVGTRSWVEKTLNGGAVPANGVHVIDGVGEIRSATLGQFPEVLKEKEGSDAES